MLLYYIYVYTGSFIYQWSTDMDFLKADANTVQVSRWPIYNAEFFLLLHFIR